MNESETGNRPAGQLLASRQLAEGAGVPAIVLHGLLGSSRNWVGFGKSMEGAASVFGLDLRNHGGSFHADTMEYPELVDDVLRWLDHQGMERVRVIGHSMGGKVAMVLATRFPERVERLVVADIAPVRYEHHYRRAIEVMYGMDLSGMRHRREVDEGLRPAAPDWALRQFLLTNLEQREGGFAWKIHLRAILEWLDHLADNPLPEEARYEGPSLLLCGDRSSFVRPRGEEAFRQRFPGGEIRRLPGGHNIHVEAAAAFTAAVKGFWGS